MGLDIRLPIGLMFLILGLLLAGFGLFSDPSLYARSLGVNVNLAWGLALCVFGAVFLFLSRKRRAAEAPPAQRELDGGGHLRAY